MAVFSMKQIAEYANAEILQGDANRTISKFCTNSKAGDDDTLFIPVIGERVDGHDFIPDAYAHGVRAAFTQRDCVEKDTENMTYLKVDSPTFALQRLGAAYRDLFTLPIIGITGSVGKTTTKEMIAAALSTKNVLKTEGNMNSQVGLPQMMTRITKEHDLAVIEMGMSQFGEMQRLAAVAKPEFAVMTNIGVSHIGQLKTMENIRMEKANICNYFTSDSCLLVNGDDKLLRELYEAYGDSKLSVEEKKKLKTKLHLSETTDEKLSHAKVVTFGTDAECTVYATDIKAVGETTTFVYHYKKDGVEKTEPIKLSVLGHHNILNALSALYVADYYGIEPSVAKQGLEAYHPISMRGGIDKVGDYTIIDDSYNASPDSMKGAINIMLDLPKENRKIIVFADILELGEISDSCHYEVGEYLSLMSKKKEAENKSIDEVLTIGVEAKHIARAINDHNKDIAVKSFENKESALEYLMTILEPKDAVLFKGSRGMQLDVIANQLKQTLENR